MRVLLDVTAWTRTCIEDGVGVTSGGIGSLEVTELRFPPRYLQRPYDPERGYVAVVLEGSLEKAFARGSISLRAGQVVTIPASALHAAEFGQRGARVLVIQPFAADAPGCGHLLRELRVVDNGGVAALAERIVAELRAPDAAAPVAAEGLTLELVAAASRAGSGSGRRNRPAWLAGVLELLHDPGSQPLGLGEIAEAVGVDSSHLARVFRREYGVSVGTYLRRLRLDRAAARLAGSTDPVARIAAEEGFADQSHFTRAFKRHTGVPPALYRRIARG
jgi:AraC family transcriptional regulator